MPHMVDCKSAAVSCIMNVLRPQLSEKCISVPMCVASQSVVIPKMRAFVPLLCCIYRKEFVSVASFFRCLRTLYAWYGFFFSSSAAFFLTFPLFSVCCFFLLLNGCQCDKFMWMELWHFGIILCVLVAITLWQSTYCALCVHHAVIQLLDFRIVKVDARAMCSLNTLLPFSPFLFHGNYRNQKNEIHINLYEVK